MTVQPPSQPAPDLELPPEFEMPEVPSNGEVDLDDPVYAPLAARLDPLYRKPAEQEPEAPIPTSETAPVPPELEVQPPEPEPPAAPAADELTPEEIARLVSVRDRLRDVPAERLAALDYFLVTGEFPTGPGAEAASATSAPPDAPPVAPTIDFEKLAADYGPEVADIFRTQQAEIERVRAEQAQFQAWRQTQEQADIAAQRAAMTAAYEPLRARFAQTYGLDDSTLGAVEAAAVPYAQGLMAQGHNPLAAVEQALEAVVRSQPEYFEHRVEAEVVARLAAQQQTVQQRTGRKLLASQVSGTPGTAPREVQPLTQEQIAAMTPEQRRAAMLADARTFLTANDS